MPDQMKEHLQRMCEKVAELDTEQQAAISLIAHGMALQKELSEEKVVERASEPDSNRNC